MEKIWTILKTSFLALIILFSLLIILSTLNIGGRRLYVVKSGSMEPAIHTGSIVLNINQTDYQTGDTITFKIKNSKDTVTHRITEVRTDANGDTFYVVKGDANDAPDSEYVSKDTVVGKVSFSIPLLGYLIAFIKTLPGLLIFIIIPATIIVYDEIKNIHTEFAKIRRAKQKVGKEVKKVEKFAKQEEKKLVKDIKKVI